MIAERKTAPIEYVRFAPFEHYGRWSTGIMGKEL